MEHRSPVDVYLHAASFWDQSTVTLDVDIVTSTYKYGLVCRSGSKVHRRDCRQDA